MSARPANPGLRQEIVAVATAIVETEGVDRLTMREVAARVGYSPTSIYLHFRSKDELLDTVVTDVFERFEGHLRLAETGDSPLERYRERQRAYVEWGIRNPDLYRLMFETMFDAEYVKETKPEVMERRMRGLRHMSALLSEAEDQGLIDLDPGAAERLTFVSWAAVHGITSLTISWRLFGIPGVMLSVDEVVEHALGLTDAHLGMVLPTA